MVRNSHPEVLYRKDVLRKVAKFTGKHLHQSLFFTNICRSEACNFIKNETQAQTFSCEFCEIYKFFFFTEHLQATGSVWFCLSKLEKLWSESEELKEASLDNKLDSLIVGSWNLLKDIWILITGKLKTFALVHKHLLFHLLHFLTSNYFNQIFIFSN